MPTATEVAHQPLNLWSGHDHRVRSMVALPNGREFLCVASNHLGLDEFLHADVATGVTRLDPTPPLSGIAIVRPSWPESGRHEPREAPESLEVTLRVYATSGYAVYALDLVWSSGGGAPKVAGRSLVAGRPYRAGSRDGIGDEARFSWPDTLAAFEDPTAPHVTLCVTDVRAHSMRMVDVHTRRVSTLALSTLHVPTTMHLPNPAASCVTHDGRALWVLDGSSVRWVSLVDRHWEPLRLEEDRGLEVGGCGTRCGPAVFHDAQDLAVHPHDGRLFVCDLRCVFEFAPVSSALRLHGAIVTAAPPLAHVWPTVLSRLVAAYLPPFYTQRCVAGPALRNREWFAEETLGHGTKGPAADLQLTCCTWRPESAWAPASLVVSDVTHGVLWDIRPRSDASPGETRESTYPPPKGETKPIPEGDGGEIGILVDPRSSHAPVR
jgi:hypothetical protein